MGKTNDAVERREAEKTRQGPGEWVGCGGQGAASLAVLGMAMKPRRRDRTRFEDACRRLLGRSGRVAEAVLGRSQHKLV